MAGKERRQGFSSRMEMATLLQKRVRFRDRVVVALSDTVFAAWIARRLRRLGWGVHQARSAMEVHRLTKEFSPQVVVLETQLPDESGWLTCEKILRDDSTVKVVLVVPAATVALAGTPATAVLLLDSATTAPPAGAALVKVTLPCDVPPPVTLMGFSARVFRLAGGGTGVTVSVLVRLVPL